MSTAAHDSHSVNPVTAGLAAGIVDPELLEFIRLWDRLEGLMVSV